MGDDEMSAKQEYTGFYETDYIYCCVNYSSCDGRYETEEQADECCSVCSACGDAWDECVGQCEWCDECYTPECENSPDGDEPCPEKEEMK